MKNRLQGWALSLLPVILITTSFGTSASAANWSESIKIKGDLRYRNEIINKEGAQQRHRQRIRARIGIFGKVNENIKVGIQVASGSDDPVSTNQTLGGGASTKPIGIDLAYFEITIKKLPRFRLTAGKMKLPFIKPGKSELIWDGDFNPEGGVLSYSTKTGQIDLTLTGAALWIEERKENKNSYISAVQAVLKAKVNEKKTGLMFGAGFFGYSNTIGYQPFYDSEDSYGNAVTYGVVDGKTVDVYLNDYELLELFCEVTHDFQDIPVTVIGDFVTNTAADSLGTGWLIGLRVGKAKKPGSWQFRYIYRKVESESMPGVFTDSDFIGGGTDGKGHELGGVIQLAVNTTLNLTWFKNQIGVHAQNAIDYNRLQAGLQFKF